MPLYIFLCSCFSLERSLLLAVFKIQTNKPKVHSSEQKEISHQNSHIGLPMKKALDSIAKS